MPDFVWVRDTVTRHQYPVAESAVDPERHEVVEKQSAYDENGDLRPAKPHVPIQDAKSHREAKRPAAPSQTSTTASEPTTKE